MDEIIFSLKARELVANYYNHFVTGGKVNISDVYIVWLSKVLQNNKALLSTPFPDNRYFEVTYNGDKDEFYLDCYVKNYNACIKRSEA